MPSYLELTCWQIMSWKYWVSTVKRKLTASQWCSVVLSLPAAWKPYSIMQELLSTEGLSLRGTGLKPSFQEPQLLTPPGNTFSASFLSRQFRFCLIRGLLSRCVWYPGLQELDRASSEVIWLGLVMTSQSNDNLIWFPIKQNDLNAFGVQHTPNIWVGINSHKNNRFVEANAFPVNFLSLYFYSSICLGNSEVAYYPSVESAYFSQELFTFFSFFQI